MSFYWWMKIVKIVGKSEGQEQKLGYISQKEPFTKCILRNTYTKIGTIQRRLAWPLRKDDTQIREAFHIFHTYKS